MNKKAMAILIIASLGFFIAVLIFYSGIGSRQPGPESPYLGHNPVLIYNEYYEAESRLLYLDNAALISWKKSGNDLNKFKENLQKYLDNFNLKYHSDLSIGDYEFFAMDKFLKAKTEKQLKINSNLVYYNFNPNFRVYIGGTLPKTSAQQITEDSSISLT